MTPPQAADIARRASQLLRRGALTPYDYAARAEVGAARGSGRLRSSHPLRCAPRHCCRQAGAGKQAPQPNWKADWFREQVSCLGAMTEIRWAWMEWMAQTTRDGTQMSRDLLWQAAERQQRLVTSAMQGWMEQNARVMRITMDMTQTTFRPFIDRAATGLRRDR